MSATFDISDAIPPAFRSHVRIEDGVLVVAEDRRNDATVVSLVSNLRRRGGVRGVRYESATHLAEVEAERNNVADVSRVIAEAVQLFNDGYRSGASDIDIQLEDKANPPIAKIFYRVDGVIALQEQRRVELAAPLLLVIYRNMTSVSDNNYTPSRYQSAKISDRKYLPNKVYSIRVESGPTELGSMMSLRLLYVDDRIEKRAEQIEREHHDIGHLPARMWGLCYLPRQAEDIHLMCQQSSGLIIFSGPTGAGKSTTLKHALEASQRDHPGRKYITSEDPPEYPIKGVIQRPVMPSKDMTRDASFLEATKSNLRADPDVLMIGEIRDRATANAAVEGAMTGHQVLTTLHANNAFNIITRLANRLRDEGQPPPWDLITDPSILVGLVFQKLVGLLCPSCKVPYAVAKRRMPRTIVERIDQVYGPLTQQLYAEGDRPNCPTCHDRRVKGRRLVGETVVTQPELLERVLNEGVDKARRYWYEDKTHLRILDHAMLLAVRGMVDPLRVNNDVERYSLDHPFDQQLLQDKENVSF